MSHLLLFISETAFYTFLCKIVADNLDLAYGNIETLFTAVAETSVLIPLRGSPGEKLTNRPVMM